jgi:tRNA 2-selenouridine synthase
LFSRDVNIEKLLEHRDHYTLIDVRSPGEYSEANIPGAVNIPLFTNDERAVVGTTYKEEGKNQAKWKGMEIVSPKLPLLMEEIKKQTGSERQPVLYCWRGGMRSQSMTAFALMSGLPVVRLEGGYRAYRQYVTEHLSEEIAPDMAYVLHGLTGVGKTRILNRLKEWDEPVLDLEGYAGHRGSVFGAVGIQEKNQKMFDSLLFDELIQFQERGIGYVFMEAESRRIGRVVVPDFIMEAKSRGVQFHVTAPLDIRIDRIYEDYITPYQHEEWFTKQVTDAFNSIGRRMETSARNDCYRYLVERKYRQFIRTILIKYYDPRYSYKKEEYDGEFIEVNAESIENAAAQLRDFVRTSTK